jgi:hypothetical protein
MPFTAWIAPSPVQCDCSRLFATFESLSVQSAQNQNCLHAGTRLYFHTRLRSSRFEALRCVVAPRHRRDISKRPGGNKVVSPNSLCPDTISSSSGVRLRRKSLSGRIWGSRTKMDECFAFVLTRLTSQFRIVRRLRVALISHKRLSL